MSVARAALAAWVLVVLAACSGGSGGGKDLATEVALSRAEYLVLDIADGSVEIVAASAAEDRRHRIGSILFRRLPGGTVTLGQADGFAAQADETPRQARVASFYCAVFELSQAQWRLLGGDSPWSGLPATMTGGDPDDLEAPAVHLRYDEVVAVFDAYASGRDLDLALPSPEQWEYACRAGGTGVYAWGDEPSRAAAAAQAVTWETASAAPGLRRVGSRAGNRWGLHDFHGNAWEWLADRSVAGGSWAQTLAHARSANRLVLDDPDTRHPLVGCRPVLVLEEGR